MTRAQELATSGRFISADEARQLGVIDRIVARDQVFKEAAAWQIVSPSNRRAHSRRLNCGSRRRCSPRWMRLSRVRRLCGLMRGCPRAYTPASIGSSHAVAQNEDAAKSVTNDPLVELKSTIEEGSSQQDNLC
ncbi:hypothetical protein IVA91_00420 [Bradyrhizobium sp. 153]|nr:hypothetical protein [Bradyrhizobium sp. 153]